MEDVAAGQWKYTDGKSWKLDQQITVLCLDVVEPGLPRCLYEDQTAFVGSDLPEIFGGGGVETNTETSAECIDLCERTAGCRYWTWVMEEKVNCFLKSGLAKTERRPKHVSGSDPSACTVTPPAVTVPVTTPLPTQQSEQPKEAASYDENEINGKFKIMMAWDDKFNDPESQEYQDLANTIETDLEEMLRKERDLSEQVEEFTVKVQQFTRGSVVCDFKVNYILKEAYIAIPFAIKPSNITTAMGNNFKFKKGILFQRFLIAGGSFNASSPVDHCAAKGCSHKCNYDYSLSDYLCTCPPGLQLASDSRTCVEDREETSSRLPEIQVNLVPSDCLWSAWSDWSACSVECGGQGRKERRRRVEIPERNGGSCLGRNLEFEQCEEICQETTEGSQVEIITAAPEGRANPQDSTTTTVLDEATETNSLAETDMDMATEDGDVERSTETAGPTTVRAGETEVTTEVVEQGEEVNPLTDDVSTTNTEEVATESPTEAETVKIIFPLPEDPTETTTEFAIRPVKEQTDVVMTTETIDESIGTDMVNVTTEETKVDTTTDPISAETTVKSEDTITTVTSSEATTVIEQETESAENVDMDEIPTIVVIEEEQTTVKTTTSTENELDDVTTSMTETTAGPEDEVIPSKRPRLEDDAAVDVETTPTEKAILLDETTTASKVMDTVDDTTTEKVMDIVDEATTTEKVMDIVDDSTTEKVVDTIDEDTTTKRVIDTGDDTTTEKVMDTVDEATTTVKVMDTVDEATTTEKVMETVEAKTEKVMDTVDEATTTEKVMETIDEATTMEKVMETIDEATTTEKAIETIDETTTTEKALEAVDETTKMVTDTVDENTTTEKVIETVDETTAEKVTETVDETTTEKAVEPVDETTTTTNAFETVEEFTTTDMTTTTKRIMEDETTTLKEMLTTMEVVAISESDDDITVVTTQRSRLDEEAFTDTTTTTTTVQPKAAERQDEQFLCQPVQTGDDSGDLPMKCEHISGDQEKSVMLLIPRDVIGDRQNRLFDKNVKIVVRDFMLMDRSPRRLY